MGGGGKELRKEVKVRNVIERKWNESEQRFTALPQSVTVLPRWETVDSQLLYATWGLPWWLRQYRICLKCGRPGFNPWVWKIPWRRAWQPTPVFLPGESHGQRSLVGYGLWDHKESDMTKQHTHIRTYCATRS